MAGSLRRQFLRGMGTVGAISVAGCTELIGDTTDRDGSQATQTATPAEGAGPNENQSSPSTQGDPRQTTRIDEPTTIDQSGEYELGTDLSSAQTCVVIDADDVVLDGRGHRLVGDAPDPEQHGIHVSGDAVTITDLTVSGWDEGGAGVFVEAADTGEISNVTVTDNQYGIGLNGTTNIDVTGNTVADNGQFGVFLDRATDNAIRQNAVTGNVESGVMLWESATNRVLENTIRDNDLVNNLGGIHLDGDQRGSTGNELTANELVGNGDTAIILIDSDENEVTDNRMENNGRHGIFLEGASTNTLTGNTATQNAISGIDLAWESDENTIEANTLTDNAGHGIWLIDSHGNDLGGNSIDGNDQLGIILADASENVITGNEVVDNTLGGIDLIGEDQYTALVGSHDNEISNNDVLNNEARDGTGIRLLHSNRNTVAGNTVSGTEDHGISLFDSVENVLSGNTITGNAAAGIQLEVDVENLVVTGNLVGNNRTGVVVGRETTDDVSIDANDLVDNAEYGVVVQDVHDGRILDESDDVPNVEATNNWWGDSSGPSHERMNPDGAGDRVGDNVDFDPWAETRFVES